MTHARSSLPPPPYFVVTFANQRRTGDDGYAATADAMVALAAQQPGFLGMDSARGADGFGITNSYWESEESIRAWKAVVDHQAAQARGRRDWYQYYHVRIGRIERSYSFERTED